jgi:ribose transport system permease protein
MRNLAPSKSKVIGLLPLIIFLALLAYVGAHAPNFFTFVNLGLVLTQSVTVLLVVIGLSAVVMAGGDDVVLGGIDLSIPATTVLCAGIVAVILGAGGGFAAAAVAALVAALLVGLINAVLITRVGMSPLLATLAMFVAIVGVSNVITQSKRINVDDPIITALRTGSVLGIPLGLLIAGAIVVTAWHFLHRSPWGMNLQAAGGSRDAAEISGIRVNRLVAQSYILAALTGFVTGFFILSRASGFSPGVEDNLMLEMVLATFLGAAFSPRRVVTMWGAVLGAVLVAAISIGFKSMGVDVFWTGLIKGALIVVVVALSALAQRGN